MTTRMTTRTTTVTDVRPASGPAPVAEVPAQVGRGDGWASGVASPGAVRPQAPWAPVAPGVPARPAGRRDARRPAGRPGVLVTPLVRPVPSSGRVGSAVAARARARAVVLRRRRTVATVVLGAVLLGLVVLAVRLAGAAAGDAPSGPVPAGSAVVVVAPGQTLIDVAHRAAPAADTDAVVARIRTDNHLVGSTVTPGRPLVVPTGS
jgi:hypothetical protein